MPAAAAANAAAATGGAAGAAGAPPPAQARGAFIVLEGVDRCGKSTQCARLVESLKAEGVSVGVAWNARACAVAGEGRARSGGARRSRFVFFPSSPLSPISSSSQLPAQQWRFPDRTTDTGRKIDAYLGRKADLDDGAVHLLFSANRWEKRAALLAALAGGETVVADRYAFSGVAFTAAKGVAGLGEAWAAAPDAGLPAPDAVLYLDLAPAAAAARGGFGAERYEEAGMLASVRAVFEGMASRGAGGCEWVAIDAAPGVEEVGAAVRAGVAGALGRAAAGAPVRALWDGGELAG